MRQPEVVRVITRLNIGGPARQALLLSRRLEGWTSTLLAGTAPEGEGELLDERVKVERVDLVRPLQPTKDARALWQIRRSLATRRPDIVHTHMAKAGTLSRVAALTMRARPKLVHTFHGHVLEGYFGRVATRGFLEVERTLARRTDRLVAVSEEIRDQLLDLRIGTPEQYRVVPLGFELDTHFAVAGPSGRLRAELGIGAAEQLVGIVGRLAPIKDVSTTLRAFVHVPRAHLAVLGDGELRLQLEREAIELGLAGRVHFVGWWHDMPAAMSDLDLAVLSSRNEGTPVALIEAAACGVPAVATRVGGVPAVVEHETTGLLVDPGDPRALADAIIALLDDDVRRGSFGAGARERARRFTADRLIADIRALYEELLSSS